MIPVLIPCTDFRADYRSELVERLGGSEVAIPFVDTELHGAWWNLRRCLQFGLDSGYPVFATVHDDVFPVKDFQMHLAGAVAAQPDQFFGVLAIKAMGQKYFAAQAASAAGYCWTYVYRITTTGCVWPRSFAEQFVTWIDVAEKQPGFFRDFEQGMRYSDRDDIRVLAYLEHLQNLPVGSKHLRVLVTVPSLVEHFGNISTIFSPATGKPQQWRYSAQVFSMQLDRQSWDSRVYVDPRIYPSHK